MLHSLIGQEQRVTQKSLHGVEAAWKRYSQKLISISISWVNQMVSFCSITDAAEKEAKVKESVERAKEAVALDVRDGTSWSKSLAFVPHSSSIGIKRVA